MSWLGWTQLAIDLFLLARVGSIINYLKGKGDAP